MPRYSVTIVASAAVSLAETSSTTATFSARGFSVVMYTSSRFYSGCSHCSEHREERGMCLTSDEFTSAGGTSPILRPGISGYEPAVFGERPMWFGKDYSDET